MLFPNVLQVSLGPAHLWAWKARAAGSCVLRQWRPLREGAVLCCCRGSDWDMTRLKMIPDTEVWSSSWSHAWQGPTEISSVILGLQLLSGVLFYCVISGHCGVTCHTFEWPLPISHFNWKIKEERLFKVVSTGIFRAQGREFAKESGLGDDCLPEFFISLSWILELGGYRLVGVANCSQQTAYCVS